MNKKLLSYLLQDKRFVFATFLLILASTVFAQLIPYIQGLFVDNALINSNYDILIELSIIVLSLLILDVVCKLFLNLVMFDFGNITAKNINKDVFSAIINKPYDFFETKSKGDILYRTNTYIYDIGTYISKDISSFAIGIARVFVIFVFLFILQPVFALCLVGLYIIIFFTIIFIGPKIMKGAKQTKNKELYRNAVILQNIEGMETFLAYSTGNKNLGFYSVANEAYDKERKSFYRRYNFFFSLIDFLVCMGAVIIYIIAFSQSVSVLEIGVIVAVLSYTSSFVTPMKDVAMGLANIFDNSATLTEVFEFLKINQKEEIQTNTSFKFSEIQINCKNVFYKSLKNNIEINNLNLEINAKDKILIYGVYGIGKSSFVDLLCGLIKPDKGKIFFNTYNINSIKHEDLSKMISVTSDNVGVFNASVFDNVKFAKVNATDEEVIEAITISGLSKVLSYSGRNYNWIVSEEIMSEGDKQFLSLARVVLRNPPVVIVDEAIRDLSENRKRLFLESLKKFTENKTLIFITEEIPENTKFEKIYNFEELNKKINN